MVALFAVAFGGLFGGGFAVGAHDFLNVGAGAVAGALLLRRIGAASGNRAGLVSDWASSALLSLQLKSAHRLSRHIQLWAAFWFSIALSEARIQFAPDGGQLGTGQIWLEGGIGLSWS